MNTSKFKWVWTALITPFKEWDWIDNEIDYEALENLLEIQIRAGVTWVLLLWTTGENPTIWKKEWEEIVKFAIDKLKWKIKVMVNLWTYSTSKSLKNTRKFDKIKWIDAYLVVNPYYNKPTQTWLYKHFTTIANSTKTPIFLYNIKARTGVNLETETLLKISKDCKNVIWVKEASWDLEQIKDVINKTEKDFLVLSWDDSLTYDLVKNGWWWVVSVASNCIPKEVVNFVDLCLSCSPKAKELNNYYNEFFTKLFIQTNPLPAKTFLADKWLIEEEFRLPICKMDDNEKKIFLDVVKKYNF